MQPPEGDWVKLAWNESIALRAPRAKVEQRSGEATAVIRPENIQLATVKPNDVTPGLTVIEGTVESIADAGPLVRLSVVGGGGLRLTVSAGKREFNACNLSAGATAWLPVAPDDVHVVSE